MSAAKHAPTPLNARYDGRWYFCWLIERRDTPQPMWWTANCTWTTNAGEALWFARESDAQADAGECPHDVKVCEHGFDFGDSAPINSHDALVAALFRLVSALDLPGVDGFIEVAHAKSDARALLKQVSAALAAKERT